MRMNGRTSHDYLSRMIHAGMDEGHCGLCDTSIQNYLEELVCPHWFLKNGARGLYLKRLARVFQVYDIDSVLHYLQVVAEREARPGDEPPFQESCQPGQRVVLIRWRKRRWIFQQHAASDADYSATQVTISTFCNERMVEKGTVTLGPGVGEVRVAPLLQTLTAPERMWDCAVQGYLEGAQQA